MVGDVANGGDMAVTTAAEGTWHMTTALPSSSSVVVLVLVLVGDEGMDVPASMSPSLPVLLPPLRRVHLLEVIVVVDRGVVVVVDD